MSINCVINDTEDLDLFLDVGVVGHTAYLRIEETDGNNFTGTRRKVLGDIAVPLVDLVKAVEVAKDSDRRS